jgi:hypothetical protein
MKCCICDKEIDIRNNKVPAQWFGKYISSKLVKVICLNCIIKAENLVKWRKE